MSKIELIEVHILLLDDVERELAVKAIRDTGDQVCPQGITYVYTGLGSLQEVERRMWHECVNMVPRRCSHILFIQYDGWVLDGTLWDSSWLHYDYIGAPWDWHSGPQVGNGGFSLRSTRLLRYLSENRDNFPLLSPEDDTLCRRYRPALELAGFRWAPIHVARRFSFERTIPDFPTFGFHGIFNWPHVLSREQLAKRKALATNYARARPEWKQMEDLEVQLCAF